MNSRQLAILVTVFAVISLPAQALSQSDTGTVSGQIRALDGSPAVAIRVAAMPVDSGPSANRTATFISIGETDSSGRFKLEQVPPGRYYVAAGLLESQTWFPGKTNLTDAAIISVASRATVGSVDFQLSRSGGVRVTGSLNRKPETDGSVRAVALFNIATRMEVGEVQFKPDDTFEFPRVPPGTYSVSIPHQSSSIAWSSTEIRVDSQDLTGIVISTGPFVQSFGRAIVAGGGPVPDIWLSLTGPNGWSYVSGGIESPRDSILRFNLPLGEYRVDAVGLPSAYSVETLKYGETNLLKDPMKIEGAVQELSIAFKVAIPVPWVTVRGKVLQTERLPVELSSSNMVLRKQGSSERLKAMLRPDGAFEFSGILPGEYEIWGEGVAPAPLVVGNQGDLYLSLTAPPYRRVRGNAVMKNDADRLPAGWEIILTPTAAGQSHDYYLYRRSFDGSFEGWLPEGEYQMRINIWDSSSLSSLTFGQRDLLRVPLIVGRTDIDGIRATFQLRPTQPQPSFKVKGRVWSDETRPAEGRRAILSPSGKEVPLGADGSFEFSNVSSGTYSVLSGTAMSGNVSVMAQDIDGVEVRPQWSIDVQLNVEGHAPPPGFGLVLKPVQKNAGSEGFHVLVRNDLKGTLIPHGDYRVEVEKFPSKSFKLLSVTYGNSDLLTDVLRIAGKDQGLPIIVSIAALPNTPGVRVSGRVLGTGNSSSRLVNLRDESVDLETSVDDDGRFEFTGIAYGVYGLSLNAHIPYLSPISVVVGDSDLKNIELRIPAMKSITGRVVVAEGNALPEFQLLAWINAASGIPAPQTGMVAIWGGPTTAMNLVLGTGGSFEVTFPEGEHRLELAELPRPLRVEALTYGSTDLLRETLRIRADDRKEFIVKIGIDPTETLRNISGVLSGLDRLSRPVSVVLTGSRFQYRATLAADGTFTFPQIPPDNYTIRTNPAIAGLLDKAVVVADRELPLVQITVPELKLVKVRTIVEDGSRPPAFSFVAKLNGTEGYRISPGPSPALQLFSVSPLAYVCTGDVCTNRQYGQWLNEPILKSSDGLAGTYDFVLPIGDHQLVWDRIPQGYSLKSATYGAVDLLKTNLKLSASENAEIVVTLAH